MNELHFWISMSGALAFGVVVGWITSRCTRRAERTGLTDIATVIGAVGGAAVAGLFSQDTGEFGAYSIGLAFGFFLYIRLASRPNAAPWLGNDPSEAARSTPRQQEGQDLPGFASTRSPR